MAGSSSRICGDGYRPYLAIYKRDKELMALVLRQVVVRYDMIGSVRVRRSEVNALSTVVKVKSKQCLSYST